MYIEEPKRQINWGDIIKKGLLVILIAAVIFLVIWLFTKNKSNAIDVNYEGNKDYINESNNSNENNTYSEIFINNYRYFHDTAKEYFLVSNLPKNNESLKFTLRELIEKQLVLPFSYTNNTSCDLEASYVYVKNTNGKYNMTTTLVCGKEVATTNEELGCNQICVDEVCKCCDKETTTETKVENTVKEYQYKQAYKSNETIYSCPSGYTKNGTVCVKSDTNTVKATKNVTYTCSAGYTKVGDGAETKCVKDKTNTINPTVETTYSCPSGYNKTGSGANTKCYKYEDEKIRADYYYEYDCPYGYDKVGYGSSAKCVKETTKTVSATQTTKYYCPEGKLSGNKCIIDSSSTTNATPKTTYYCSEGSLVNGKYCRIYQNAGYKTYTTYQGKTYNGCSYSGSYVDSCSSYSGCTKTYYKYYCAKTYKDVAAQTKTTYSCSSGTLSGSKCIQGTSKTVNAVPTTIYSCPEGKSYNGGKCKIEYTDTKEITKEKVYYCSNDDQYLDGRYCYDTVKDTRSANKNTTYSCPSGYTKTGSGSSTKCTNKGSENTKPTLNITYSCPSGYNKVGIGANSTCTKGNTVTVNATKSSKEVTKYNYKWSTAESLVGWEKTGQTRNVKASSN